MSKFKETVKRRGWLSLLLVTAAGIALNILGTKLNAALGLPLFIDNTGTILSALLGGGIPCITAGFLTNIILGFSDPSTTYYCVISVMVAVAAVCFSENLRKFRIKSIILAIMTFAFLGGVLGGALTWLIGGFNFGEGFAPDLAADICSAIPMGYVASNFLSCFLIDLADKAIVTVCALFMYRLLPESLGEYLRSRIWYFVNVFTPRNREYGMRISLREKVTFLVISTSAMVTAAAIGISIIHYSSSTIESYKEQGSLVTNLIASKIDKNRIDEFMEKGRAAEGYEDFEDLLYALREASPEITYIYIYRIEEDGSHVIFDLDAPDLDADEPGDILEHDSTVSKYLDDFLAGKEIPADITNDEFGWLLSVYHPILDDHGAQLAYACVDLPMDRLSSLVFAFLARVISLFLGFFILTRVFAVWIAERQIILPINAMAAAATGFSVDTAETRKNGLKVINDLDIHTGDELERLHEAYKKTTAATVRYIDEALQKGEQIRRLQNGLILVLADIVESRDKCTGDHVRKTAGYSGIILRQMQKDGIYADRLTDEYIDEVVNSAPLHDIGKIQVPDAILNKPGRLTDEEFDQMKTHAAAGGEIIDKAISIVGESSYYLTEAKNLAAYHHEKWNGTGYPAGLAGEEIPLSARVMAVADVFDALVSRRSYKEPFPVDKAIDIIREGSGTHFDPQVVRAFLEAEDQIRETAKMNLEI